MNAEATTPRVNKFILAVAAIALGCGQVQAAQHCVSTGTQLANALNSAASNNQDDEIRIVATTLSGTSNPVSNPRWSYSPGANDLDKNLTITGGWSSGNSCNSQISTDPSDTVLDANFTGRALQFQVLTGPLEGDVVLRNFTISRGSSSVQNSGTSLEWRVTGSAVSSLLAENLLIVAASSSTAFTQPVMIEHSGSGNAKLRNLMVYGNSTQGTGGIFIRANNSAFAILSNASIFDNHCACAAAGLGAGGVVTLANNAVADNTSSAASSFQFRSDAPTGLTLRNNHFGTKSMAGNPSSESGTTTGDAHWNQVGSIIIPNTISPLRDSGINNPTGQLSSTDFKGDARIVNTTVDRGAVEAEAIPHIGPTISAVSPTPGTGLFMPDGLINTTHTRSITFAATGGTGGGTTSLVCTDNNNAATLSASANQTIAVGDAVAPVVVTMTYTQAGYNLGVFCTANTNGNIYSFEYAFFMPGASPLGPMIVAVAPQVGSTTTLSGQAVGDLASTSLTFTAQGGAVSGQATLVCAPLSGVIAVTGNASQTVASGGTVLPVEVSMQVTGQAQSASVRCIASRIGSSPVNMDYTFNLNTLETIFNSGFED